MRHQGDRNREEKDQRESNTSEQDFEIYLTNPPTHFQMHVCTYVFMLHRLITDNYTRDIAKNSYLVFTDLLNGGEAWESPPLGAFHLSMCLQSHAHT